MAGLSISRAWDETKEVLRRDGNPIATVALALLVLPGTLSGLVQPTGARPEMPEAGWWTIVQLLALLIGLIAQLAVAQIAIGRRQAVGQAIGHAVRRSPVLLGAILLWVLPLILLLAPFARQIQANPTSPNGVAALAFILGFLLLVFLGVRFIFLTPVVAAEPIGPIATLTRSWALTKGSWWRLFAFLVVFFIGAVIAVTAVTMILGVLVGLADGPPEQWSIGALILALASQILSAVFTVLLVVMVARLYAQVATPADDLEAVFSVPDAP